MDINQVFNFVTFVSNKYQSGGLSPDNFNLACNVVSRELFNKLYGVPEDYKPGSPYPAIAYDVTQKITDDLRNFIHDATLLKNANGYFVLPADYAAFSSLSFNYVVNSQIPGQPPTSQVRFIEVVTDSELRIRTNNSVIPPEPKYPIAVYKDAGIKILPNIINNVTLTYLKFPVIPVFAYTVVNDEYIYDAANSVQSDFPDTLSSEFAMRIVRYLGINISDVELEQAALQRLAAGM